MPNKKCKRCYDSNYYNYVKEFLLECIDLFKANYDGIMKAFWETNYMMLYSMLTVFFISLPLGIMLFAFSRDYLLKNRAVYEGLSISLNALRSVPFLYLYLY